MEASKSIKAKSKHGSSIDNSNEAAAAAAAAPSASAVDPDIVKDQSPTPVSAADPDTEQDESPTRSTPGASAPSASAADPDTEQDESPTRSTPGAFMIAGPNSSSAQTSAVENNDEAVMDAEDGEAVMDAEVEPVVEGFLPPKQKKRRTAQEWINELLDNAITLSDDAVRPVPMRSGPGTEAVVNDSAGDHNEGKSWFQERCQKPMNIILLIVCMLLAIGIVLGVVLGIQADEAKASYEIESSEQQEADRVIIICDDKSPEVTGDDGSIRFDHARRIASEITPPDILNDHTSPQGKAIRWIVCNDNISIKLLDNADARTGILPKQKHGSMFGGDSGESQLMRRYILATLYFSTSQDGPWNDDWNFLQPETHECGWHKNYTRENYPFGQFDPAGTICQSTDDDGLGAYIQLDDELEAVGGIVLNFRIENNLTGILPKEMGYLADTKKIMFENQVKLTGSIPLTIGRMTNLESIAFLFSGPKFGGELPSALFSIPSLEYASFQYSSGSWNFPNEPAEPHQDKIDPLLKQLMMKRCGLTGTLPDFISKFTNLEELDLEGNKLHGSIPISYGDLASLEYFSLYDNQLNGTLPNSLGKLLNTTALVLGKNRLRGELPSSLGGMSSLQVLDLSFNEFEGSIPNSFSSMASLQHVSLQNNNMTGPIHAFQRLQFLSSLILTSNSFSGEIPDNIFSGNSSGAIVADFARNKFTGGLPQAFRELARNKTISYLSVAWNNLASDVVEEEMCDGVPTLLADCSSCTCCEPCCDEITSYVCDFDLNFYQLVGLDCGAWWPVCSSSHYDLIPTDDEWEG